LKWVHHAPDSKTPHDDGELSEWEVTLARRLVEDFLATRRPFRDLDADDLLQECLARWWLKRRHYSEDRGASLATFMRRVLKARLVDIDRRERATKRGGTPSRCLSMPGSEETQMG